MTATPTDLHAVADAVVDADAAAFVAIGDGSDADFRYLTRFSGADRACALVVTPERAAISVPPGLGRRARAEFVAGDGLDRTVERAGAGEPPGVRARTLLDEHASGEAVLAPPDLPHDAALYVDGGGYELASTTVVGRLRRRKDDGERAAIGRAGAAAAAGIERAEELLGAATVEGGRLQREGTAVTPDRLRTAIDAAVVDAGGWPVSDTAVDSGPSVGGSDEPLPADEPIAVAVGPRGSSGYHALLGRTFVVSGGGWPRRAYVACERARRVALDELAAGTPAGGVRTEAIAELGAYGFEVDPDGADIGGGVGLSRREPPALRGDDPLRTGDVVGVDIELRRSKQGTVRLVDTVAIREDGVSRLPSYPVSSTPRGEQ